MTDEQIIEREWRKAVNDHETGVHVEMHPEAEEIWVFYRCGVYVCDCDSDEEFIFTVQGWKIEVRFPIPDDWHPERFE